MEQVEAFQASLARVQGVRYAPLTADEKKNINLGIFPSSWSLITFGVSDDVLLRFHHERESLARLEEEKIKLPIEALRGMMFFNYCCTTLAAAISEREEPRAAPEQPQPTWARDCAVHAGEAYILRKHLAEYEGMRREACKRWRLWAPGLPAPSEVSAGRAAPGASAGEPGADSAEEASDSDEDDECPRGDASDTESSSSSEEE